jgi:hypothetical protein
MYPHAHPHAHTRIHTHTHWCHLCTVSSLPDIPQGDSHEQTIVREQRDAAWLALMPWWYPEDMGGKGCTFRSMPSNIKIDLINTMAGLPACWSPAVTIMKTDTKVATWRHELSKRPAHKRTPVHTRPRTTNQTHMY